MANTIAPHNHSTDLGILVCIEPTYWARYKGTRAQLEAEGVIPKETKWPERGVLEARWEDEGLKFTLKRTRPEGMKGPMKLWIDGDYWAVDIDVKGRGWQWRQRRNIEEKAKALADEIYRQSAEGQRELKAKQDAYWKAHCDKEFKAFKALVPGLIPPKRGRKAAPAG